MAPKRPPNRTETLPSGFVVDFWDSVGVDGERQQRRYAVNGERVPSVTTILGVLAKPALLDWAARLAREGKDWREVRQEAAERGTDTHGLLHRLAIRKRASLSDLDAEHRAWGQAAFKWVRAARPKVIEGEFVVACHDYAGRPDLLAMIDGVRTLADAKTLSKWSYNGTNLAPPYDENLLQLDLYQGALMTSGYEAAERGLIVRLGPDGEYHAASVELDPDRGLAILEAYRAKQAACKALRRVMAAERDEGEVLAA